MSTRYPGGIITKTTVVPSGPYENSSAPGIWTLDQQLQFQKAGLWPTPGAFPTFIEDVFSTYLYTGNGSTQTITNGIDLSGKGGLVWLKERSPSTTPHKLYDTIRGAATSLQSNTTAGSQFPDAGVTAFNSNGFTIDNSNFTSNVNNATYVSWTFREQAKFFDVVTYTGNGSTQNISHNLGSVPGCIFVKCSSVSGQDWFVYHRTQGNGYGLLNTTDIWGTFTGYWNNTAPTSTQFSVGTSNGVNGSGLTMLLTSLPTTQEVLAYPVRTT